MSIILLSGEILPNLYLGTIPLVVAMLLLPTFAFAQNEQYQLIKSSRSETFDFPFTAANRGHDDPLVYTYDSPKGPSWILTIANNLTYTAEKEAKTIIRIQEPAPSEKYIEIAMYGGENRRFSAAVNLPGEGYRSLYDKDLNGWSTENPISLSHVSTAGLSITDGKRIIVDRFDMGGFDVGSIAVFGKDESTSAENASQGDIRFDILFGNIQDSPLYLVPAIVTAGVGGVIITLLLVKKRKPSD